MLLNETQRIREWIAQGDLRAPVNGTVLHRHHPAGECIKSHDPLFSMMEESSLEIEMFLPQEMTADFSVGDAMQLRIEPFAELVPCTVTGIGSRRRTLRSSIGRPSSCFLSACDQHRDSPQTDACPSELSPNCHTFRLNSRRLKGSSDKHHRPNCYEFS